MKITIGEYEVEIKVKGISNAEKFNELDTQYFLNELSIVYREASAFEAGQGRLPLANGYRAKSKAIYTKLDEMGVYNKKAE